MASTTMHAGSATHAHTRSTATGWTISGVGFARILYGALPLALLANGFAAGTGLATPALTTLGIVFVIHGIAITALAGVLTDSDKAAAVEVTLDALVAAGAVVLLTAGWNHFTAEAGLIVLGAVAVAALSAVVVALTVTMTTRRGRADPSSDRVPAPLPRSRSQWATGHLPA